MEIDSCSFDCVATFGLDLALSIKSPSTVTGLVLKSIPFSTMMSLRNNRFEFCLFFELYLHALASPWALSQLANCLLHAQLGTHVYLSNCWHADIVRAERQFQSLSE